MALQLKLYLLKSGTDYLVSLLTRYIQIEISTKRKKVAFFQESQVLEKKHGGKLSDVIQLQVNFSLLHEAI